MRGGGDTTPAHDSDRLAEMVCSNSFRSDDAEANAVGLLHQEMRALGSLVMAAAEVHKVPAGSALAVDREGFADEITRRDRPPIPTSSIVRERVDALPASGPTIIATGPLTAPGLAERDRRGDGQRRARLLRRHRPDRPPRQHRHGHLLDGGALGQGRQGLHQLPDGQGAV